MFRVASVFLQQQAKDKFIRFLTS